MGYRVPERPTGAADVDSADSFYLALIAAAGDSLRGVAGGPTPDRVHQMVVDAFAEDMRLPNSRYRHLISGDPNLDQVLANLEMPASWDRQSLRIVPYVAAHRFGLELGILGTGGAVLPVTDVTGPRVHDPDRRPILLVRMGDRDFREAVPVPTDDAVPASADNQPAPPADGAPAETAKPPAEAAKPPPANPWTAPLSPEEQRLVDQESASAPLPPGTGEPAAVGRVAEMRHLARAERHRLRIPEPFRAPVRDDIRRLLSWPGAQPVPSVAELEDRNASRARLDALERVYALVRSAGPRAAALLGEYRSALAQAEPEHDLTARQVNELARRAAYVRMLGEQADTIARAVRVEPAGRRPRRPLRPRGRPVRPRGRPVRVR